VLVVYVPFLQNAFHTVALSAFDWAVATAVASTLLVAMESVKLAMRAQHRAAFPAPQA
jgi:Ca2+-transporting ATPase